MRETKKRVKKNMEFSVGDGEFKGLLCRVDKKIKGNVWSCESRKNQFYPFTSDDILRWSKSIS